ncbi:uncharacterized protein LOC116733367 isoform X2 [Xiphophorus hellerii]|uniref:uncharacterized protein LOC116733367 isoform X2 n=1 Tax=Xiphophorus hellerii TaxID=8084 RepID=UPI0013B427C5|nr:uncharacterized protein LOC116733367 isoform X2 [Xiphophorus hellerii]
MAQAEELEQILTWLTEEGFAPEASKEAQLAFLWRTFLHTRSCLDSVTKDLGTKRLQHFAEMAEVRKSLEQIKIFTEQKDVLAQEIQDENEQLRKQLLHLVSLQDSQINEVAKMLYQQGLTELIHSSPSEQVAYLLVERASLLEMNQDPGDGDPESRLRTHAEPLNPVICRPPTRGPHDLYKAPGRKYLDSIRLCRASTPSYLVGRHLWPVNQDVWRRSVPDWSGMWKKVPAGWPWPTTRSGI